MPKCRRCKVLYGVVCRARLMECGCCRWCVLVDTKYAKNRGTKPPHEDWDHGS